VSCDYCAHESLSLSQSDYISWLLNVIVLFWRDLALALFTFITHEIYLSIIDDFSYGHVWRCMFIIGFYQDLILSWSSLIKWHTLSWLLDIFGTHALNIIIHEFLQLDTNKINVRD